MRSLWRVITSTRELWGRYGLIGLFTILVALFNLLVPLLTGWAIDELQQPEGARIDYLLWIAAGIFALEVGVTVASNTGGYIADVMAARLNKILSVNYYEHLLRLSQSYFDRELTGKIINRLNRSIAQISRFMQVLSNNFLQFIFSTIFSLIVVAIISWPVAALLSLLYPVFIWLTVNTSKRWQEYQEEVNLHSDVATGRFTESVSQIKVVKSFIQEARELKFFALHSQKAVEVTRPQSRLWHSRDVWRRVLLNIIFLAVYAMIFVFASQGRISTGQAVTLILYAAQIRIPIFTISFLVDSTQRAIADSRDYFEIMNLQPEIIDAPGAGQLQLTEGVVTFDDVHFSYDESQTVLRNVSFTLKSHTKTALVAQSGGGKTTIANLLLRLYEPTEGRIFIDGQDIAEVTQKSLREHIGVVFQDPALFSGTIRENITYAYPHASDDEIKRAAKAANAHTFISEFEKGYDTEIGERGLKLSGGQKQRIAIARALLKDAPILILDEATSSLDSRAEGQVQAALEQLMEGRTTLIIAHRLSTIQHVDTIIALEGGEISEQGPPVELAKTGGLYSQLLQLQEANPEDKKRLQEFDIVTD